MKKYRFTAKIQAGRGGGAFIFFPYDVEKEFGTTGKVPVMSTFDGVEERGAVFPYGMPEYLIGVSKAARQKIGKGPGDAVSVVLWKDETERVVDVPPDFRTRMKREKILAFFEGLSFTHRKEYVRWITEAKKEDTRRNRFEKAIQLLKNGVKTPG